ncbi:Hypothetical predicted protein [Cloeon dipterum]|uniref:Peroxin-14 n=1 Tax=Cloeon dipterum TaxID=197152 RepID=A0A8S1CJK9_9INSE|nr:Hypothetical predicted protein [Cloeon dipterum]
MRCTAWWCALLGVLVSVVALPAPGRRALDAAAPPAADPAGMAAKKADFLNKLFGGLGPVVASPDPAAPPAFWSPPAAPAPPADDFATQAQKLAQLVSATLSEPVATEAPAPAFPFLFAPIPTTPKPTIVPPGFWLPSSPIAAPGEYVNKVSEFLEKLFASKMPTPAAPAARSLAARHHEHNPYVDLERERSLPPPAGGAFSSKDMVLNSILSEVAELKGALMDTVTDMVAKQKSLPFVPPKKIKILPPWVPTPPPTPDPLEPYQKRLETLGQVFDMLTGLGQDVTAPKNSTSPPAAGTTTTRTVRSIPVRSVQMAVHQGHQSMPPGTEELISVGAGRDPNSAHEGGGLNLKIKVPH